VCCQVEISASDNKLENSCIWLVIIWIVWWCTEVQTVKRKLKHRLR